MTAAKQRTAVRPSGARDVVLRLWPAAWPRPTASSDDEGPPPMRPALAAAIAGAIVAALIAGGVALDRSRLPSPQGALAACRTAPEVAPHVYSGPPPRCIDPGRSYSATFVTTKGRFTVRLTSGSTPETVNNFIVLAENGYYDGLTFFKSESWYVQTGDPENNGHGGPGYTLPAEPLRPGEHWEAGALGMARLPDGRLSGSQFFILRAPWQGGEPDVAYNRFATITQGANVVTQLTASDRILHIDVSAS